MQATSRKEASRKSAEWTGFLATTTAAAIPSARAARTTKTQPRRSGQEHAASSPP